MATRIWNPTIVDLKGMSQGIEYLIPAGKQITIKSTKTGGEHVTEDEIIENLMNQLGPKGLCVIDIDNPVPVDVQRRTSLRLLNKHIESTLHTFNQFNVKQAAKGLETMLPTEEITELVHLGEKIRALLGEDGGGDRIISQKELRSIATAEEVNAHAMLARIESMLETGATMEEIGAAVAAGRADKAKRLGIPVGGKPMAAGPATSDDAGQAGAAGEEPEASDTETLEDDGGTSGDVEYAEEAKPAVITGAPTADGPDSRREIITPVRRPGRRGQAPRAATR